MAALAPRHIEALHAESRSALELLASKEWIDETYLAGSAALALYANHRMVRDLDLMTTTHRLRSANRRDLLESLLAADPGCRVETARDGYLSVQLSAGPAVRLYYYPYPRLEGEQLFLGVPVASLLDLSLMKIAAIISRGTKRDFVDLYLIAQQLPFDQTLDHSPEKFGHVVDFPLQALKGCADFSLADPEPMPTLNAPLEWPTVRRWFEEAVRTQGRARLGLETSSGIR